MTGLELRKILLVVAAFVAVVALVAVLLIILLIRLYVYFSDLVANRSILPTLPPMPADDAAIGRFFTELNATATAVGALATLLGALVTLTATLIAVVTIWFAGRQIQAASR